MTSPSMTSISEADYCTIEDALQSTEKGRRFLRTYVDRNRSLESRRLLRSISRLHRAALGAPGLNADVSRDLVSVLRSVAKHRKTASGCDDATAKSNMLATGLQEVEACLMALIESIEERAFEAIGDGLPGSRFEDEFISPSRSAKLVDELSTYFSAEQQ